MLVDEIAKAWGVPADLAEHPIDSTWKGTPAHMKVDPKTTRVLWGLSGAAVELLHASAVLWTYWRFRSDPAAAPLKHLAEALFARQASPRCLQPIEAHRFFPQTTGTTAAQGATALLLHLVFVDACAYPYVRSIRSVLYPANLSIGIAKHVMPKGSRAFGTWLAGAEKTLRARASLPGPVAPPAKDVSSTVQQDLIRENTAAPFAPLALHTRLSLGNRSAGVMVGTPEEIEQARLAYGTPLSPWILGDGPERGIEDVVRALRSTANPMLASTGA